MGGESALWGVSGGPWRLLSLDEQASLQGAIPREQHPGTCWQSLGMVSCTMGGEVRSSLSYVPGTPVPPAGMGSWKKALSQDSGLKFPVGLLVYLPFSPELFVPWATEESGTLGLPILVL